MSSALPAPGAFVRVRHRHWLVEEAVAPPDPNESPLVSLSCVEDDAQGERLDILWKAELDAAVIGDDLWERIGGDSLEVSRKM